MTSARPYRPPLRREEAVAELLDKAGTQFHPAVARAFVAVLLDEPLRNRLSESELAELRRSFARVRVVSVPTGMIAEPRLLAMAALVSTLVSFGIPNAPRLAPLVLASLTCCLLGYWIATEARNRARRSRAQAAIDANASPEVVVAAAGFAGWAAFTAADNDEVLNPPHGGIPAGELSAVRSWLKLGSPEPLKRLSTGTWVLRSAHWRNERRLVLGLQRRPRVYELELAQWLADAVLDGLPPRRTELPRQVDGERALALVELRAFERIRRGAGQLVAECVVADSERRLRSVLRMNDAVVRLGDDIFAVSMVIGSTDLETLEERLRGAVAAVPVPQRLERLQPRVIVARAADAHRFPELAEVEDSLLPAPVTA
jgi:GGDEF domain-containing protein